MTPLSHPIRLLGLATAVAITTITANEPINSALTAMNQYAQDIVYAPTPLTQWTISASLVAGGVYLTHLLQQNALKNALTLHLDKWMSDPNALGNKEEAKKRILHTFNNKCTMLDLNNLGLTLLPNAVLGYLPKLTHLHLSSNDLASITLPQLPELQHLDLSNNKLDSLTLPPLPELQYLNLCHNNLDSITILHCPKLEYLDLSNNDLISITLSHLLSKLKTLNLSTNKLDSIILPHLTKLITLNLSNNELTSIIIPKRREPITYYLPYNPHQLFQRETGLNVYL